MNPTKLCEIKIASKIFSSCDHTFNDTDWMNDHRFNDTDWNKSLTNFSTSSAFPAPITWAFSWSPFHTWIVGSFWQPPKRHITIRNMLAFMKTRFRQINSYNEKEKDVEEIIVLIHERNNTICRTVVYRKWYTETNKQHASSRLVYFPFVQFPPQIDNQPLLLDRYLDGGFLHHLAWDGVDVHIHDRQWRVSEMHSPVRAKYHDLLVFH